MTNFINRIKFTISYMLWGYIKEKFKIYQKNIHQNLI